MRRPVIALLALAIAIGPASARAQDTADDQLISDGVALRKEGRDAEALALFERALTTHRSARALAQIALAHQALTDWLQAERSLLDALAQADDPWIASHRVYLEQSLAAVQTHLAWLSVDSNVAGAELYVDADLAGRLPLDGPLRVAAGTLVVQVRAQGYGSTERAVQIEPGAKLHEFIRLEAEHADAGERPSTASPIAAPEKVPAALVGETPAPAHSRKRDAAWITIAGAGALLAGGITAQVLRENQVDLYNDDSVCLRGPGSRDDVCGSHRSAANTDMAVAIVLYAGAAVAAGASAYLFLTSRSRSAPPATAHIDCTVAGLGLACGGVF